MEHHYYDWHPCWWLPLSLSFSPFDKKTTWELSFPSTSHRPTHSPTHVDQPDCPFRLDHYGVHMISVRTFCRNCCLCYWIITRSYHQYKGKSISSSPQFFVNVKLFITSAFFFFLLSFVFFISLHSWKKRLVLMESIMRDAQKTV
jgi:hypothetical protein